jgi:hypothetical protein
MSSLLVAIALSVAAPQPPPAPAPPPPAAATAPPPPPTAAPPGAAPPLSPPAPPFPAPKLGGTTPDTKCDWGPIADVKGEVVTVKTDAGNFEVKVSARARVSGPLTVGQKVRVYYRVDNKVGGGAIAQEVDTY